MKKVIVLFICILNFALGFSQNTQEVSVEKSVFGVQVGLIGIWVHNELKLSSKVALRSEFGVSGINTTSISPQVSLEPRFYYNLERRASKNKRIDGNSGNYISLRASYSFHDESELTQGGVFQTILVPSYGIRRNLGKHFNYEVGGGLGLGSDNSIEDLNTAIFVNLRLGYRF